MTKPVISIVSDESVTVFYGGRPFVLEAEHPRFKDLVEAIGAQDHDRVDAIVNASDRLSKVLGQYGDVTVFAGQVTFQGRPIHNVVVERVLALVAKGRDPEPYALFLDRVMRNPTREAADMLLTWVERAKLPILPDGRFLAYRYVRMDYLDGHTATMDNSPGRIIAMPRSSCDTNYQNTCSRGLHFCNHAYLRSMSGYRCLIMAEDPSDVVSFPQDGGGSKGRTEKHEALFEISMSEASAGIFFKNEDEHIFGWDRVQHYKREQLKFITSDADQTQALFDAHDAGWRVCWIEDGDKWGVYDPAGLEAQVCDTREAAHTAMVERFEEADEDFTVTFEVIASATNAVTSATNAVTSTTNVATSADMASRLTALEATLNIIGASGTITDRLDRIETEIGLPQGSPPHLDRLARAEQVVGL